jgi:hypothetical protein
VPASTAYVRFLGIAIMKRRPDADKPCAQSRADIVHKYPQFYWNSVAPYIQSAIRYLNVTANGRQWVANLYSNVFRAERDIVLGGPQQ